MKPLVNLRPHLFFCIIFFAALFVRLYRLDTMTTFGRDQGIDFASVKEMILTRKPTLLGIQVSIGEFHQGPVYLYMLTPLFMSMHLHPLAGAYTAVIVSMLTIVVLYVLSSRFFSRLAATINAAVFAFSPSFVREGATPLYQHFVPLFLLCGIYALLSLVECTDEKKKHLWSLGMGVCLGISLELHFLTITCVLAALAVLWFNKFFSQIFSYWAGLLLGVSPTLLFELRHDFLNTRLLFQYFSQNTGGETAQSMFDVFTPWLYAYARWIGGDSVYIGALLLVVVIVGVAKARVKNKSAQILRQLLIYTISVTFLFQLALRSFEPHYLVPIVLISICLISVIVNELPVAIKKSMLVGIVLLIGLNILTISRWYVRNHGYYMPPGWSLRKIIATTAVIVDDAPQHRRLNVASLLDGDTRAYPLRYTLDREHVVLDSVEAYPVSETLYIVSPHTISQTLESSVWELSSYKNASVSAQWNMGDGVFLYRLDK